MTAQKLSKPTSKERCLFAAVIVFLAGSTLAQEAPLVAGLPAGAMVPDAEVDADGIIHVAYLKDDDVFYVRSNNEGTTFAEPIRVNTEAGFAYGARFRGPDLAVGKDHRVHVIWYNAGYQQKRPQDEWGVMYARLEPGTKRFGKDCNLNQRPSDNFSLAADGKGNVAVIWMAGGIFATLSHDGGKTFLPATDLKVDPCECCGSRAIYSNDGGLSVLYRDKTDNLRDTNIAILAAGSAKWISVEISKTPWQIDSCPMTGSFLSHTRNGLAAAWETKSQIYFATLDGTAATKPREIRVPGEGRYPVVLVSDEGTKLVAWKNDTTLEWQFFGSDDQPRGDRGSLAEAGPDRPSGVVTQSGRFVLFP
jgi:hypothetical protein